MACYRAKVTHTSTTQTRPGVGGNWRSFWEECDCCPVGGDSSSSSSSFTSASSESSAGAASASSVSASSVSASSESLLGSSSSASPTLAGTGAQFVTGKVPDWNQPMYYQTNQNTTSEPTYVKGGNTTTPFSVPNAEGGNYAGLTTSAFLAWCAPTVAACQLGHLNHHYNPPINVPTHGNNAIGDNLDAGADGLLDMTTINWNSARSWADYMVDGPLWRGKIGSPNSIGTCENTDFGWWMDTNGEGNVGSGGWKGTKQGTIYTGLTKFYANLGYHNFVGMAYHYGHNTSGNVPPAMGETPYSNNSERDLTQVWNAIKNEIDNNRTVQANTMGYEIQDVSGLTSFQGATANTETQGRYYTLGAGNTNTPITPVVDGTEIDNGEQYSWEVADEQGLGHSVLIIGYIESGTIDDIAPISLSAAATNWIIVRDNFEQSHRNVILPFDQALSGSRTFWQALLSTCYVHPDTIGASYSSTCNLESSTSPTVSSSLSSASSTSPAAASWVYYDAYPCGSWNFTNCASWNALTGSIPLKFLSTNDASPLYTCGNQTNSAPDIEIKIVKVYDPMSAIVPWGGTTTCALLIKSSSVLPGAYGDNHTYTWGDSADSTWYNTCAACSSALTAGVITGPPF